ncbi:MAG: glycine--tRNA ligase [SAR202 cluster bacterium Casp-Chloro-G4]|nr:glycine--tRNA ligase [Chloroflexota bacterium]PKB61263.1 MAG: glycine--tRNA ligase [SAR202 cluster bacterium Casp-Chloro-G4]
MSDSGASSVDLEKIVSLAKRRGFIFQSSEIYGGLSSTWDYGPLGVELKRNIKDSWWRTFVWERDDMVGLDASILMHPDVWRASGHIQNFSDPLVDCKECRQRWREDQLEKPECPACGGELTDARNFNLMFKTFIGPIEDDSSVAFLRPETAQGIFVNFENVLNSTRKKLPFGIAQIGKAFRNEITTGNFIFRTREFEIMEIEFFVKPGEDEEWHKRWLDDCMSWYTDLGVSPDRLRVREHEGKELAHYAKATYDIEYQFPWGWGEIQGVANRTDFDLKAHSKASGTTLDYFDQEANERVVPYVIEPAAGVDRGLMAFLVDAYTEEEVATSSDKTETRVLLKFHPDLAPVKVAVLPLSRNEKLAPLAAEVYNMVRKSGAVNGFVQFDDAQSIGRRYRRQDEIGTPLCVTVDFDSLDDNAVTIRDRDTMNQVRVPIADLSAELAKGLSR